MTYSNIRKLSTFIYKNIRVYKLEKYKLRIYI